MAGSLVASALLSGVCNVLFDRLATKEVLDFLRPKEAIRKLLWQLDISLLSAHNLLDDAEEKQIEDDKVEKWLFELKDVFYKAGELTDKIETEALRLKMEGDQSTSDVTERFKGLFSTLLSPFDKGVKAELECILSLLNDLLAQKDGLGLEAAGRIRSRGVRSRFSERLAPVADESCFCGREDTKVIIIESLLRSDDVSGEKISVIPIIGAGGLGKTALAQVVYDHPNVKQHFGEHRAWVTVSTEFDLPEITKRIFGQFCGSQIDGNGDPQVLLSKLNKTLKGRKFLLVLDDVWSDDRDEWHILKSCFKSGEPGSKIIVTTRSRNVASVAAPNQPQHFLAELPEEECWRLFARTVFTSDQDRDAHPNLREIGKKIVEKCKGVPLSVISVAGILCGDRDPEYWETILKSSVWELLQQDNKYIIPSLWLSYLCLPPEIKPCFAYCSLFPKDYPFEKEVVVRQWMAEGFLKKEAVKSGITMEVVGNRYFEELISRSLFQRSKESAYLRGCFIMHDLVHDLAMKVSGEFSFCFEGEKNLRDLSCKIRYLSCNKNIGNVKKSEGLSKAKRLHSFVGLRGSGQAEGFLEVLKELATEGGCLRVLSSSLYCPSVEGGCLRVLSSSLYCPSVEVDSIGNLKHLRYLNLSETALKKLPDSVGTLYNLQTLLLSRCVLLTQLPSNLGRLINLHHLDTRDSPLVEMPPHMCNLTKLQSLSDFVVGKRGSSIGDLRALHDLNGELRISGLQNVEDVSNGILEDKKSLSKLVLEWEGQIDDSIKVRMVLDALQPHANLKELVISNYGGTSFPNWVGDSLFSKIEEMNLNGCQNCLFLPSLGRLPSLKKLTVEGFHKLETIDEEFYGNDSPFKSLEVLHFDDIPEWKSWSDIEVPRLKELWLTDCKNFESFSFAEPPLVLESFDLVDLPKFVSFPEGGLLAPNLKNFYISKCENLSSLPQQMNKLLPSLKNLLISDCEELESWPEGGLPSNLEFLGIWGCKKLAAQFMHWDLQTVTPCLNSFRIDGCGEELLDSFPPEGLLPASLTYLKICNFRGLKTLNIHAFQHLEKLYVTSCNELQCLPEESLPNSLSFLSINDCPLLEQRFRKETGEGWHKISHIPCVSINMEIQR